VILVRESSSAKGAVDVVTGVKKLSRNKMERGMEASFRERERERERGCRRKTTNAEWTERKNGKRRRVTTGAAQKGGDARL